MVGRVRVLLGITLIAAYTVVDAQGVRAAPTALSYIVWTFVILGGVLGSFFALWRGRAFFAAAAGQWKPGLIAGAPSIAGVAAIAAGAMALIAAR
jgi:hypothetical protein